MHFLFLLMRLSHSSYNGYLLKDIIISFPVYYIILIYTLHQFSPPPRPNPVHRISYCIIIYLLNVANIMNTYPSPFLYSHN